MLHSVKKTANILLVTLPNRNKLATFFYQMAIYLLHSVTKPHNIYATFC